MAKAYDKVMNTNNVDIWQEISRVFLLIMYALLAKTASGYHYIKDKYTEYKYGSEEVKPAERYLLTALGDKLYDLGDYVPFNMVYIEEWRDTKGHIKSLVSYEGDLIPIVWGMSPFDKPPAKCPWVWVGDKETEVDMTRMFDMFLVPGNVLKEDLVSRVTKSSNLIYIETKTFNTVKFPGDGITIEADVD